jgi:hypothetical protein
MLFIGKNRSDFRIKIEYIIFKNYIKIINVSLRLLVSVRSKCFVEHD